MVLTESFERKGSKHRHLGSSNEILEFNLASSWQGQGACIWMGGGWFIVDVYAFGTVFATDYHMACIRNTSHGNNTTQYSGNPNSIYKTKVIFLIRLDSLITCLILWEYCLLSSKSPFLHRCFRYLIDLCPVLSRETCTGAVALNDWQRTRSLFQDFPGGYWYGVSELFSVESIRRRLVDQYNCQVLLPLPI